MSELLPTVLLASFVGSLHCIGMCGPLLGFVAGATANRRQAGWAHAGYHLGRLVTYTGLGAVAGSVGAAVDVAGRSQGLSRGAATVAGGLILVWGAALLLQTMGWLPTLAQRLHPSSGERTPWFRTTLVRIGKKPPVWRSALMGLASTLLPCGWLYGFAVVAAGTGHPATGAAVMATFWLGGVPALLGAGWGMKRAAGLLGPRLGWVMPALLMGLGLMTVLQRQGIFPDSALSERMSLAPQSGGRP